jgi:hypothetical protein
MRTEANRDELSKFFDMYKIDQLCDGVANMALKGVSVGLIPIVMEMKINASEKELDAVLTPSGLEKQFRDIMGYCFNKVINYINTYGEKGIEFSNFVRDYKTK